MLLINSMLQYRMKSPVLFLIFNRPDTTHRVFSVIREAAPSRLYIAADGPRDQRADEEDLCLQARNITERVDWPCEVKLLFRDRNLGCKEAVSSAISWFFEQEEEGIVLEDDCLPSKSFFPFCDLMLEKYRFDSRIRHITGSNLRHGEILGNASYYFSTQTNVWGWASWRRVWEAYDKNLSKYDERKFSELLKKINGDELIIASWMEIFRDLKANRNDTWDYQYSFLNYFNHGLSVVPNKNLICNIGFREDATHTLELNAAYANIPLEEMTEVVHPDNFLPERQADLKDLYDEFDVERRRNKQDGAIKRFLNLFK